jgi:hypothetical protein
MQLIYFLFSAISASTWTEFSHPKDGGSTFFFQKVKTKSLRYVVSKSTKTSFAFQGILPSNLHVWALCRTNVAPASCVRNFVTSNYGELQKIVLRHNAGISL